MTLHHGGATIPLCALLVSYAVALSRPAPLSVVEALQTTHPSIDVRCQQGRATIGPPKSVAAEDAFHVTDRNECYTTAILKVAYDGTHFRGSAGQLQATVVDKAHTKQTSATGKQAAGPQPQPPKRRQSRRSRTLQRKGGGKGVRTVEGTLTSALAKIYGDVNPKQITIDSCSRTDAGVHATSLVSQFYCESNPSRSDGVESSIPKRPASPDDTEFLPLPFDSDLSKLVFVLNRMLPPDLRVVSASPLPYTSPSTRIRSDLIRTTNAGPLAFHPTLHTTSKTYTYQFAIGPIHDPIQSQYVWHLDGSSARAVGMNGKRFSLERALAAADLFADSHDKSLNRHTAQPRDYGAFRSAFRGTDRGRIQSTICTLWRCEILQERREMLPSWEMDVAVAETDTRYGSRLSNASSGGSFGMSERPQTYTVVISGDRFLYKMIRNIVGTIVAVGCGHLELEDVSVALETGTWGGKQSGNGEDSNIDDDDDDDDDDEEKRTIRRICAPARGLSLVEVDYPEEVHFDWQSG